MVSALGLASVLFRQSFGISWRGWMYTHFVVGALPSHPG